MSALLELIKETPPEDLQEVAITLAPYLPKEEVKPQPDRLLSLKEFQQRLPIKKRLDWLRNDLFQRNPELKRFAFNLNAGKGHPLKISEKAVDWINNHVDEIDWRG